MGSTFPMTESGPGSGGPKMQKSSTLFRVKRREYEVWLIWVPGSAISGLYGV
jgi:hypothetical protein